MTKQYYMFIPLDIDKEKNTRFVVETDGIPTGNLFSGRVIARNKKAYWYLNAECEDWVNPIADLKNGSKPSFLPINRDEAIAKFEEHCIEE